MTSPEIILEPFSGNQTEADTIAALHLQSRLRQLEDGENQFSNLYESQEDLKNMGSYYVEPGGNFWIARDEHVVAGFVGLRKTGEREGMLKRMAVMQEFRGQRIGQLLGRTLLDWAVENDYHKVHLSTGKDERARELVYEPLGFVVVGFSEEHQDHLMAVDLRQETKNSLSILPDEILTTDTLKLRKIEPADAADLHAILENNRDIQEHVAWASRTHAPQDVIPALQRYSNEAMDGRFALIADNKIMGYMGISPGDQDDEYGIGYFLDATARGNGHITNAVAALIDQARTHLGAKHVYIQIKPYNQESIAVAQSLGFQPAETVMGVDFPVQQQRWRLDFTA